MGVSFWERDIHLKFDQEEGYVVMTVELDRSVETSSDLISDGFIRQVNKAFPESGIYNLNISYGYLPTTVFLYYQLR